MLLRALFLSALLAPLVLAQTPNSEPSSDGLFADFPEQCMEPCSAMEGTISTCANNPESQSSDEATIACVCNENFVNSLQSCGNCIIPIAGIESESGGTVAQIAIAISKQCGLPVNIEGLSDDPRISSILASPSSASYTPLSTGASTSDDSSMATSSPASSMSSSGSPSSTATSSSPSGSATNAPASSAISLKVGLVSMIVGVAGTVLLL